jgi:hypothetical protein
VLASAPLPAGVPRNASAVALPPLSESAGGALSVAGGPGAGAAVVGVGSASLGGGAGSNGGGKWRGWGPLRLQHPTLGC